MIGRPSAQPAWRRWLQPSFAGRVAQRAPDLDLMLVATAAHARAAKLEADPARPLHFLTETGVGYRFVAQPAGAPSAQTESIDPQ